MYIFYNRIDVSEGIDVNKKRNMYQKKALFFAICI